MRRSLGAFRNAALYFGEEIEVELGLNPEAKSENETLIQIKRAWLTGLVEFVVSLSFLRFVLLLKESYFCL